METKRLRPVLFKVFIPPSYQIDNPCELIEGTNQWSNHCKKGVFHAWGTANETTNTEGIYLAFGTEITVGIVEDLTGYVHIVKPDQILFTDV